MSKPVVVLNSGGFDSTVLLHYVKEVEEDSLVYSLFLNTVTFHGTRKTLCA